MEAPREPKQQVLVPFVCPVCAGANGVHLISLSRSGGVDCASCGRWLKSTDIMRAIHSPRSAQAVEVPASGEEGEARTIRVATKGGTRPAQQVSRKDSIVWPPTAASRAAVKPLYTRK